MDQSLPNLLNRSCTREGDRIRFRFGNGLEIVAETMSKPDPLRILPLGGPQGILMNFMMNRTEWIAGRSVFEPFAGSGALGFMALKCGAGHVDFLDVNPRTEEFLRENARLNGFKPERYEIIIGDIGAFAPTKSYDLILANPPFVPTPDGIGGTITSNGGPDGNKFTLSLLGKLDALLEPGGEAMMVLMQIAADGVPLVLSPMRKGATGRPIELTAWQEKPVGMDLFIEEYSNIFPGNGAEIESWKDGLFERHGRNLTISHYVAHIGTKTPGGAGCRIIDDWPDRYGAGFALRIDGRDIARGRIAENLLHWPAG